MAKPLVYISHAPMQPHVGLEEVNHGQWAVYFGRLQLDWRDERTMRIDENGTVD